MKTTPILLILVASVMILITGCGDSERVAQVATQAADRQAAQNQEMARLQREVAEGSKRLVEADAKARQEIVAAQKDLQAQQAEVGHQRDRLEGERKAIASQRQTDSLLAPVLQGLGILLFGGLVIGLCGYLLHGLRNDSDASQELNELLVTEIASNTPTLLLGPTSPPAAQLNSDGPPPSLPPSNPHLDSNP